MQQHIGSRIPSHNAVRSAAVALVRLPHIGAWIVALAFIVMTLRLAHYVSQYAVNILFWDQWDFLQGLFDGADTWTLFRWQHGPQRQGLGNVIIAITYSATGWNGKADAAVSATAMLFAGLLGVWLVRRLCGNTRPWDVAVPLLFLTTTNAETYVVAPNLAHGPLPAVFLVAFAVTLSIRSHLARCVSVVAVTFLAVNTGFTVLLGAITPIVLLLLAATSGLARRDRIVYVAGAVASLGSVLLFLRGFVPLSATECFQFPHDRPQDYVPFAGFVLLRPFGIFAGGTSRELLMGSVGALIMIALAVYSAFKAVRYRGESPLWLVASTLTGFSVLFAASTAVGRVCLGMDSADASRYIPYVLPGLLAIYVMLRTAARISWVWTPLLCGFLVASVLKELPSDSLDDAELYSGYKRRWQHCYLATHQISTCDEVAGHAVYPAPEVTQLQAKLDWLEARGYSLFQERVPTTTR